MKNVRGIHDHTSGGPKDDVVLLGVASALKKVEEPVSRFNIDVACIWAKFQIWKYMRALKISKDVLHAAVTKQCLFDSNPMMRESWVIHVGIFHFR